MTGLWHHAYYIEGSMEHFGQLKEELRPFMAQQFERLGVEEARELAARASLRVVGEQNVFLLAAAALTVEAQQALLKLFEEPQEGVVFVLLVPHGLLLPTLRSRMLAYVPRALGEQKSSGVLAFLKSSPKERSEAIAALLKEEDGARERAREFVNQLEVALYAQGTQGLEVRQGLAEVAHMRSYLNDRSPSLKMLLEHLALSLPRL